MFSLFGRTEYHERWDEFNDYVNAEAAKGRNDQTDPEYVRRSDAVDDAAARVPWYRRLV